MIEDRELRQQLDSRMSGLVQDRYSWWLHWRELAAYILPRRYIWLVENQKEWRGAPLNQNIIDSTATLAARTCASGMMAGITNPTRPWFKLRIDGFDVEDNHPVALWLEEVEKRMMRVFAESNFYASMNTVYLDLVVFGTAAQIIYEDFEDVIHCFNPAVGEYYCANNARLEVDVFYREFVLTLPQIIEEFGEEALPPNLLQQAQSKNTAALARPLVVRHCIQPNRGTMPTKFRYMEAYWLMEAPAGSFLRLKGFNDKPVSVPRWDVVGNDAYGRSPGMDALPDVKQLQQEQKRKAQAIDKMVNPPMVADIQLKHQPASLLPGGITYVTSTSQVGFKPAFSPNIPVQELMLDIKEVQERIRAVFFNDLFQMISQLDTVRSATEIDARKEEKLILLGPVIERFENEALAPAVTRTFNIMARGGLLPPAPQEIAGRPIDIQYVSMMDQAQRAAETAGMERFIQIIGNLAGAKPEVLDNVDDDEFIRQYANRLAVSPKVVRGAEEVAQIRQQRAQQQQLQQAAELSQPMVDGAKVLSQTQVGGGQNALARMMGM